MTAGAVKRISLVAFVTGVVGGLIAGFANGHVSPLESLAGAAGGTLFFAASAVVLLRTKSSSLRDGILLTYVTKITILLSVGALLALVHVDRATLAASIVASAIAYLTATLIVSARR